MHLLFQADTMPMCTTV